MTDRTSPPSETTLNDGATTGASTSTKRDWIVPQLNRMKIQETASSAGSGGDGSGRATI